MLVERYKSGYAVGRSLIAISGVVLKLVWWIAAAGFLIGLVTAIGTSTIFAVFPGIIVGLIWAASAFVLAYFMSGMGMIVVATLDTAVNTSPLLTVEEKASLLAILPK